MDPTEDQLQGIRNQITCSNKNFAKGRKKKSNFDSPVGSWKTLPWPAYALEPGLLDPENDSQLHFFAACETKGRIQEVMAYVEKTKPSLNPMQHENTKPFLSCLEYGLEQAAFGGHLEAVRFFLQLREPFRVPLHSCVFERFIPEPEGYKSSVKPTAQLILKDEKDLIPLFQIFVDDGGWKPDTYWISPEYRGLQHAFKFGNCISSKPLLRLLLAHGADATRGLEKAIKMWDAEAVDILLQHGAKCRSLHGLVRHPAGSAGNGWGNHCGPPFEPQRRLVAERLLAGATGAGLDINLVTPERTIMKLAFWFPFPFVDPSYGRMRTTAFSYACEAYDWDFAQWLLENGADPIVPEIRVGTGPSDEVTRYWDENKMKELVEQARQKSGRDIPDLRILGEFRFGTRRSDPLDYIYA